MFLKYLQKFNISLTGNLYLLIWVIAAIGNLDRLAICEYNNRL